MGRGPGTIVVVALPSEFSLHPGWLLDETANAGRENLEPSHVARYDAKEDADAFGEVALLQKLGHTPESVIVDLGAGTGQFTTAVASACARVVAIDVSPAMLQVLQTRIRSAHLTNVEVVHAGFLTYEHDGPVPDFAYSRYALHHLSDFWKAVALSRVHRILRRGGVLRLRDVVYSFGPDEAETASKAGARLAAWMSKLSGAEPNSKSTSETSTQPSAGFLNP